MSGNPLSHLIVPGGEDPRIPVSWHGRYRATARNPQYCIPNFGNNFTVSRAHESASPSPGGGEPAQRPQVFSLH